MTARSALSPPSCKGSARPCPAVAPIRNEKRFNQPLHLAPGGRHRRPNSQPSLPPGFPRLVGTNRRRLWPLGAPELPGGNTGRVGRHGRNVGKRCATRGIRFAFNNAGSSCGGVLLLAAEVGRPNAGPESGAVGKDCEPPTKSLIGDSRRRHRDGQGWRAGRGIQPSRLFCSSRDMPALAAR
jgi:hypothetical protein